MPYKTTRDVQYNGKPYLAGKAIPLDGDDEATVAAREQLLALDPPAIIGTAKADKAPEPAA